MFLCQEFHKQRDRPEKLISEIHLRNARPGFEEIPFLVILLCEKNRLSTNTLIALISYKFDLKKLIAELICGESKHFQGVHFVWDDVLEIYLGIKITIKFSYLQSHTLITIL